MFFFDDFCSDYSFFLWFLTSLVSFGHEANHATELSFQGPKLGANRWLSAGIKRSFMFPTKPVF